MVSMSTTKLAPERNRQAVGIFPVDISASTVGLTYSGFEVTSRAKLSKLRWFRLPLIVMCANSHNTLCLIDNFRSAILT
jgi:hypothetical protein